MRILQEKDYKLIEKLVSLTEKEMHQSMGQYLKSKYQKVEITKEYIMATGDIPIALVAHMDTVFKNPVSNLYYDQQKGVLWSPEGLGADDRAGIFAILKIIQEGLRPSVILTTGEEVGGVGASALCEKYPTCPIEGLKYLIQLDRRGTNDCVFYDCYCPEFVDYIEKFGFCERMGSFSDISFLMPQWEIVGVNLSVGYEDEHSISETLHINPLMDTIRKVKHMLKAKDIPEFLYDEVSVYGTWWAKGLNSIGTWFNKTCSKCKKPYSEYDMYPVLSLDGKSVKLYCPDCLVEGVGWCEKCYSPFESLNPHDEKICKKCLEEGAACITSEN